MNINTSEKEYIKKFVLNIEFENKEEIHIFQTILKLALSKISEVEYGSDFKEYREIINSIDQKIMTL